METEKAIKAAKLLSAIKNYKDRIQHFDDTKEFCVVTFKGENGREIETTFGCQDKKMINSIREHTKMLLMDELNQLEKELLDL